MFKDRLYDVIVSLVFGCFLSLFASAIFGKNFPGRPIFLEGIGYLHRLSFPDGPLTLESAGFAAIGKGGGDDYFRTFLNSYIWLTNEDVCREVENKNQQSECENEFFDRYTLKPRDFDSTSQEYMENSLYLKRGYNYLIVEVANGHAGYCIGGAPFKVSGYKPIGYLRSAPVNNQEINLLNTAKDSIQNIICSRRIYQFYLY